MIIGVENEMDEMKEVLTALSSSIKQKHIDTDPQEKVDLMNQLFEEINPKDFNEWFLETWIDLYVCLSSHAQKYEKHHRGFVCCAERADQKYLRPAREKLLEYLRGE